MVSRANARVAQDLARGSLTPTHLCVERPSEYEAPSPLDRRATPVRCVILLGSARPHEEILLMRSGGSDLCQLPDLRTRGSLSNFCELTLRPIAVGVPTERTKRRLRGGRMHTPCEGFGSRCVCPKFVSILNFKRFWDFDFESAIGDCGRCGIMN